MSRASRSPAIVCASKPKRSRSVLLELGAVGGVAHRARQHGDRALAAGDGRSPRAYCSQTAITRSHRGVAQAAAGVDALAEPRDLGVALDLLARDRRSPPRPAAASCWCRCRRPLRASFRGNRSRAAGVSSPMVPDVCSSTWRKRRSTAVKPRLARRVSPVGLLRLAGRRRRAGDRRSRRARDARDRHLRRSP